MRLLVGQHVAISVSADEGDVLKRLEHLDHLDRMRTEQDQVTERPPPLDPEPVALIEYSAQRSGDAVDVGDDPKPHGVTVRLGAAGRRIEGSKKCRSSVSGAAAAPPRTTASGNSRCRAMAATHAIRHSGADPALVTGFER